MVNSELQFETIFKRKLADHGTKDFLENIAVEYPYFTAAHFYLLKLTEKETESFRQLADKTSLLFNNPYWLNYQLLEKTTEENTVETKEKKELEVPFSAPESENIPEEETVQEEYAGPNEAETINIELPDLSAPVTEDTILFEPLHTSDYFASQGIKLSEEVKPDDKLGKNLKSFTEWLKTMKKIQPENLPQPSEQTEASIQKLAERSNTENEVVTEAMADVLIQQGKTSKAVEVYKKLSLLNPLKSAYFAAKIENLKGN